MNDLKYPLKWEPSEPVNKDARSAWVAERGGCTYRIEHMGSHKWVWSLQTPDGNRIDDIVDLNDLAMTARGYIAAIAESAAAAFDWVADMVVTSTITLFHFATDEERASIFKSGFVDNEIVIADGKLAYGVFFADRPIFNHNRDAPLAEKVSPIEIVIPAVLIGRFKIPYAGEGPGYHDWFIPSAIANAFLPSMGRRAC